MGRLGLSAVTLAIVALAGLAVLLLRGPQLPGAILTVMGGAASAALGGVALLTPPPGEKADKVALLGGLAGAGAMAGFLGWAVGLL